MIKVYGYPKSRSLRVLWALEEAGAAYEFVQVDLLKGEGRSPAYLQINPSGKVPALVDGDFVLTESAAIVTYVGELYPDAGLTPDPGTHERAHYLQWSFFAMAELEQPLWTIAKHQFALPEDWRVPAIFDTAQKEFGLALKVLEAGLGDQAFILGNHFSAADILISLTLSWAKNTGNLPDAEPWAGYLERTLSRPALERARLRETAA